MAVDKFSGWGSLLVGHLTLEQVALDLTSSTTRLT